MPAQFCPQRLDQLANLGIDRARTAEVIIMLGDFEKPLARNITAPCDVLQERQNIFALLRSAEANDQDGVVLRFVGSVFLQGQFFWTRV